MRLIIQIYSQFASFVKCSIRCQIPNKALAGQTMAWKSIWTIMVLKGSNHKKTVKIGLKKKEKEKKKKREKKNGQYGQKRSK